MSMVLFAIIGSQINAGVWYWICFGVFCVCKLSQAIKETIEERW
jgi:hypothetical protein